MEDVLKKLGVKIHNVNNMAIQQLLQSLVNLKELDLFCEERYIGCMRMFLLALQYIFSGSALLPRSLFLSLFIQQRFWKKRFIHYNNNDHDEAQNNPASDGLIHLKQFFSAIPAFLQLKSIDIPVYHSGNAFLQSILQRHTELTSIKLKSPMYRRRQRHLGELLAVFQEENVSFAEHNQLSFEHQVNLQSLILVDFILGQEQFKLSENLSQLKYVEFIHCRIWEPEWFQQLFNCFLH